ncbi:MAG TPA: hypothetical protein VFT99_24865, partial [Roseiflexaceae bacterium]|nr:hypothetical protein [Roseiflexaceae bacterium]
VVLVSLVAAWLAPSAARAAGSQLVVTLRDVHDRGVAGIQVTLHIGHAAESTLQGISNGAGMVYFDTIGGQEVRVAVQGMLPGGTPVRQNGVDLDGVWLLLEPGNNRLDLRVEPGGLVIPDPVMIAPEQAPARPIREMPINASATVQTGMAAASHTPGWLVPLILLAGAMFSMALVAGRRL